MGKRIKKVWIELQGFNTSASPGKKALLPKSPINLFNGVDAKAAVSAKRVFLVRLMIFKAAFGRYPQEEVCLLP